MGDVEKPVSLSGVIAHHMWRVVRWLFGGLASIILVVMSASAFGTGQKVALFGILALWVVSWCCVLVHESGHAIAAALAGWRTVVFAVQPLSWNALTRRLGRAHWVHGGEARDVGGWVSAIPRHSAAITKGRYALFVAGGPIANIALATLAFWAASHWLPVYDRPGLSISTLAATMGFVSTSVAIFNLFPSVRSGISTDGDILRRTWRADENWRQHIIIGSVNTLGRHGMRPRDRPQWMLAELRSSGVEGATQTAVAMDISAILDAPPVDTAKARAMIETFRAEYGDSEWLCSCDAYLAAVWENDLARARAIRWHGETSDGQLPLRLAVNAAIAAREGDYRAARDLLQKMRVAARAEPWMRPVFRDIDDQVGALLDDA